MNVPQQQLDQWRAFLERVRVTMFEANQELSGGNRGRVKDLLMETATDAARVGGQMETAGARRPPDMEPPPVTPLEKLDTPANRRYLERLREAWEAALEVDRERYGEGIGTDGEAQAVETILRDVETEIHGPAGVRE